MSFTTHDAMTVAELLRTAAQTEILPRFRNLSEGDIRKKTSEYDLVTDADESAERAMEGILAGVPGRS